MRLWRFRDALPDGEGLRPWIYRVVVNSCYSSARGETRHSGRRASEGALDELISDEAPAEELVETSDRATSVRRAIRALPVDLRVPLVLRYYSGLSEREIATAIRRRPGTVKSRLHEARRLLALDHELAQFAADPSADEETGEAR